MSSINNFISWWMDLGREAPNVRIVWVTPEMAVAWLERNTGNRPLKPNLVQRYVEALLRGEWKLNGEPIIFDINGRLANGQHRLEACKKSGVSFETYVVFDAAPAFETLDQGRSRTNGDVLALGGVSNAADVSAAIPFVLFHDSSADVFGSSDYSTATAAQRLAFASAHPRIEESVRVSKRFASRAPMPRASMTAIHFLGARHSNRAADDFCEAISSGSIGGESLPQTHPLLRLREGLLSRQLKGSNLTSQFAFPYGCYAWNLWVEGREVRQFKFVDFDRCPRVAAAPPQYARI